MQLDENILSKDEYAKALKGQTPFQRRERLRLQGTPFARHVG